MVLNVKLLITGFKMDFNSKPHDSYWYQLPDPFICQYSRYLVQNKVLLLKFKEHNHKDSILK